MAYLRKRASKSIFCFLRNGERRPPSVTQNPHIVCGVVWVAHWGMKIITVYHRPLPSVQRNGIFNTRGQLLDRPGKSKSKKKIGGSS